MYVCVWSPGLQDGRPADLLHQPDADHHEQAALRAESQQVNVLLAGGRQAHPAPASHWPALQLGADLRLQAVADEPQSLA